MNTQRRLVAVVVATALGAVSAELFGIGVARAQDGDGAPIHYHQFYGQGFASDEEVEHSLGSLSFSMTACANHWLKPINRSVRVSATKSDYGDPRVVETVLYQAVAFAWSACPLTFYIGAYMTTDPRYDVQSVDLYLGDGTHAISATYMHGDYAQSTGPSYTWESVEDTGIAARAQAAAAAEQVQAAQQAAEEQARQRAALAAAQAEQAQMDERSQQRAEAEAVRSRHNLKIFALWAVPIGIALFLFAQRETLARWYYFYFFPHPAAPIIRAALGSGTVLDGKALAGALSELPPGSAIFRAVRLEQAEQLFSLMQAANAAQMRKQEERARKDARDQYERAALASIQEAVALAAVALERAKALYRASREFEGA